MAKIAIAFFLFALFAVAMAARVVREEPNAASDPIEQTKVTFNKALDNLRDMTPEKVQSIISEGFENFREGLNKLNEAFQPKTAKST